MPRIPDSRYIRRAISALAVAMFLLLGLIEFLLLPSRAWSDVRSVLSDVVVGLITSLLALAAGAAVALWLIPGPESVGDVKVVRGRDRSSTLEDARRSSGFWWFSGGLGRFNRAVLIPEFAEKARQTNSRRSVILLTLDPDTDVCDNYANIRGARRSGSGQAWTAESVMLEVLATVLAAFQWQERQPLLEIELRFKATCTLTRLEVCESSAILTSEDPADSALLFPKGTPLYYLLQEEFRIAKQQSRHFEYRPLPQPNVDAASLRHWLADGGIARAGQLTDAQLGRVMIMATSQENPYARA